MYVKYIYKVIKRIDSMAYFENFSVEALVPEIFQGNIMHLCMFMCTCVCMYV